MLGQVDRELAMVGVDDQLDLEVGVGVLRVVAGVGAVPARREMQGLLLADVD